MSKNKQEKERGITIITSNGQAFEEGVPNNGYIAGIDPIPCNDEKTAVYSIIKTNEKGEKIAEYFDFDGNNTTNKLDQKIGSVIIAGGEEVTVQEAMKREAERIMNVIHDDYDYVDDFVKSFTGAVSIMKKDTDELAANYDTLITEGRKIGMVGFSNSEVMKATVKNVRQRKLSDRDIRFQKEKKNKRAFKLKQRINKSTNK